MKRNMIIATALAVAGVATYFIRRNMSSSVTQPEGGLQPRSHHLTSAFSKAKQRALSVE